MVFAFPLRALLLGVLGGLTLGCSDDSGPLDNPIDTAGAAGTSGAAGSGGTAGSTGGAGASLAQGGGGAAPGGTGGMAGAGSGGGGSGGMTIDPNGGAPPGPASGRHTARPSGSMPGTTAGYYEYVPPHYGNGALYPLLVFRHGIGENGSGMQPDLDKVLVHGPPKLIEADQWPEARPFVVLSVQHPDDGGCPSAAEMDDLFNFALDNYDIDPKRVYLTGLSCGAIGSWNYLGEHLDADVSAAVLICGDARGAVATAGCSLGKVPIWAFHGDIDGSVELFEAQDPINELKACSPAPVDLTLTVYPGVGHDSWTMTYDLSNPSNDIYAWLLSHAKP